MQLFYFLDIKDEKNMRKMKTMDGNAAAAYISYAFTELAAIYPITPSSTMAELVDQWSAEGKKNIFGQPVKVVEMQSEAGAAGVVHGSLKTGALTTTYTASQGLLLMIPNMYKIAGELLPSVFHVASRALTTNALNIFGDQGDVMAARQTGFAMLSESSVQEVMDLAPVAHLASIEASVPFMNFFDGFRTSHEIQKVAVLDYGELAPLVNQEKLAEFRRRSMNPNHPSVSGMNQNPDIHFQQRETINPYYEKLPGIVQKYMTEINRLRGTNYDLVTYYGAEDAEEVIVTMGSVAQTIEQTVDYLQEQGRKVGFLNVHLYRPFPVETFLEKIPQSVKAIAVLDRTKEPGAGGEPLLLDVQSAMYEADIRPTIIGGRYGLGSKDVLPNQIVAVFDELMKERSAMKKRFTIGIDDDLTYTSLEVGKPLDLTNPKTYQAKFWGFGSDGTVGANKSAIKIIGDHTDKYAQGFFYYDSKKSGGLTVSHLRFGETPIRSTYLIEHSDFVACHTAAYLHTYDLVKGLKKGGTFLLNTIWNDEQLARFLPNQLKRYLAENEIQFYTINAVKLASEVGLGGRINTAMETAFFKLAEIMPFEQVLPILKEEALKSYGHKSMKVVEKNIQAIDKTVELLHQVPVPAEWGTLEVQPRKRSENVSDFVHEIVEPINRQEGNALSVATLAKNGMTDGRMPLGTAAVEKRGVALEVPEWISDRCTMCNECAFVCPHAAIRPFLADEEEMTEAPEGFIVRDLRGADGLKYRIQVSVKDCTGCGLCVEACPAKGKALVMKPYDEEKEQAMNWAFAMTLRQKENPAKPNTVLGSQFNKPLLEFSGACSGCGETPYVKLLTQMFGDRMLIANATGCSSIWGAAAGVTPYTTNEQGQGPAWSNSLLEDNAEFGYGMLLATQARRERLASKMTKAFSVASDSLRLLMEDWIAHLSESEGTQQRAAKLRAALLEEKTNQPLLEAIYDDQDLFVKPSQWMIGGDGWAYDIGYGGIDHVLASGADVNMLVLDNEVYSNTGGQTSKATPASAIAKFAASGKYASKKDLGMMAMTYENVYVAQIASGANQMQTIKAFEEAEKFPGPSIIIAYTPCITHGLAGGMSQTLKEAKDAVHSGYWSLYRYNPLLREKGKEPMTLDFKKPDFSLMKEFMRQQVRFASLESSQPDTAELLFNKTINDAKRRFYNYARLAGQEEKIRAKLEKQSEPEITAPENEKPRVKKERAVDPEAEARRAARRAERAAKRKQREQD
ncbi:pyruvate:ferredoxin (flavodoxin) oxidoreductase [Enterococcus faecalis]|uniref:pyruvate:ferredoxin (flavodoxin) oxidoreductase n=1 Tax=Enterococcus faecalis TaxID=1351 RepID=UPI0015749E3D|nr:pyruvate:ferredoxin (flavodoxin) oxidoreductase [Enterococcus faecalis]EGO5129534.1 pyruvate:ferredoxin (flavodoxin) oxidoreductase [Enterococcus faecalis]EGO6067410.1 pyruvate:ferredoxin (flavodoxin) oxidoreductase [Enterococcus faecalis]EGO8243613.1 pyruvate:ferredoxin (flavodoxin) oxidoreductase [Enterococcus faecalis]EGO8312358.1 pyruvate:ferredoxin (flavodoxin) oxidoreductase [Enterococcus faecalis]EGS7944148.1 pyruvate:ferredoxin (flavodoxin) oxidoreductase [Enterococcus faecalis]